MSGEGFLAGPRWPRRNPVILPPALYERAIREGLIKEDDPAWMKNRPIPLERKP